MMMGADLAYVSGVQLGYLISDAISIRESALTYTPKKAGITVSNGRLV